LGRTGFTPVEAGPGLANNNVLAIRPFLPDN